MALWVKCKDVVLDEWFWVKVEDGEVVEVRELDEFTPDPFSRVVNVLEGKEIAFGIYRCKIVGDVAYTREW